MSVEQLRLQVKVLQSQIEVLYDQIDNFGYDGKKLQDLVGRCFRSGNLLIKVKSVSGKEISIEQYNLDYNWILHTHGTFKPKMSNGEYLPLELKIGSDTLFVEITKEEYGELVKIREDIENRRKVFQKECENLINNYNLKWKV